MPFLLVNPSMDFSVQCPLCAMQGDLLRDPPLTQVTVNLFCDDCPCGREK